MNVKSIPKNTSVITFQNQGFKYDQEKKIKDSIEAVNNKVYRNEEEKQLNAGFPKDPEDYKKVLSKVTEELNKMVRIFNRKLDFSIHEETNRVIVKVVDTVNDKVIREIPPEEILDLVAKFKDTFSIFIDVRI